MPNQQPPTELFDEHQLAAHLGCSVSLLRRDRWKNTGIPYIKLGHMVRYRLSDVEEYIQKHLIQTAN